MALDSNDKEFIQMLITSSNAKAENRNDILSEKVDGINLRLDKINGRINRHDEMIAQSIQERKIQDQKNLDEISRLDKAIKDADVPHTLMCPNGKRLDNLETGMLEVNFIRKYPKTMVLVLGVVMLLFVGSSINLYESFANKKAAKQNTEQIDKQQTQQDKNVKNIEQNKEDIKDNVIK